MAVAFRNIAASVPTSTATSVTVTCPSGVVTGDLMLYVAGNSQPTAWGTNPTGWTLITKPGSASGDLASALWYKFATGSDVAGSTTYTATCGGTATAVMGSITAYSGVDSSAFPLASTKYGLTHGTSAVTTSPAPTNPSSIAGTDLVFRVYVAGWDASGTGRSMGSAPSGWAQRGTGSTGPTNIASQWQVGMVVCDKLAGSDSLTTTSNTATMWDIYSVALPPAPTTSSVGLLPFFL